ncbi:MAG: SGNH/GDSL hydrolase family protein [Paludibacter sp.]|nr:SGNH/GDSL hydrolase family protein [Paludibacter sp.]
MKKTVFQIFLLCIILSGFTEKQPKVLIIGDSISIGYTPFVKEKLSGRMLIYHNPGNAQYTGVGLKNIRQWIGDGNWDIIQFNWGLWDLCYRDTTVKSRVERDKLNGKIFTALEEYKTNLDSLVTILKTETNAKLIFVTTTYVPENEPGRFSDDLLKYNMAAKEIMKKHHIEINDLYEKSINIHHLYGQGSDNVHYTKKGYDELSNYIIPILKRCGEVETIL